jgi:hypothetical protein
MTRWLVMAALASCASGPQVLGHEIDPGSIPGDVLVPPIGGPAYWGRWPKGPPADPDFFMLSVWLQNPMNADAFKSVGINFFTGLDKGPTDTQLALLAAAGLPVICDQTGVWKSYLAGSTIRAWLQPDGPDNAQPLPDGSYAPCIEPSVIVDGYRAMVANDPARPVFLGLGRGVAITDWIGRGTCTGHTEMYAAYADGGDILGFNDYAVNAGDPIETVAGGVDNLLGWSGRRKPVVAVLEASNYNDTTRPTPAQIKAEVWMAIVHGAMGIQYFCHRFKPTFSEIDCLEDAPARGAMTEINARIAALAPVLNGPSVANGVTTTSSNAGVPVDTMLKRNGGATYLFAVAMRGAPTTATFTLRGFPAIASAEVLDEGRTLAVTDTRLVDDFAPYGVHLYRLTF